MRPLLLTGFALLGLAVAYLVLNGGGESALPAGERLIEAPEIDCTPTRHERTGERTEAIVARVDEAPVPSAAAPWGIQREIDPSGTLLLVRALTPGGAPLGSTSSLVEDQEETEYHGFVYLDVRLSHRPPAVGSSIPEPWDRVEDPEEIECELYLAPGRPEGTVRVLSFRAATPNVYVSLTANGRVLAVENVRSDVEEVVFVVPVKEVRAGVGGFHLCLVDDVGSPVEGALIDPLPFHQRHEPARSDVDGRVGVGLLEPGVLEYEIVHEGFATTLVQFELGPGQMTDLGTIVLTEPVAIAGRLIGSKQEVLGREVVFHRVDSPTAPPGGELGRKVVGGPSGRFALEDLEPGVYALRVASNKRRVSDGWGDTKGTHCSRYVRVDASRGSVRDVSLGLEPAIEMSLRLGASSEEDVELQILDAGGHTLLHEAYRSNVIKTYCTLPSGRHRLVARYGDRTEEVEFEAFPGAVLQVPR